MAFSTALVAGSSSWQMVFVDDFKNNLKKKRMENAIHVSFLRSSFKFLKCTAVGNLMGISTCNYFFHYASSGIENPDYSLKAPHQMKGPHP